MKISRSQLKQMIDEEVVDFVNEEEFDDTKFPFPDVATKDQATQIAVHGPDDETGKEDDDVITVTQKDNLSIDDLQPSQREIRLGQALSMAIGQLASGKIGGDLGAIISGDNLIMDGHHRWAATIFAGGDTVGGKQVSMPGEQLVKVLALFGDYLHPGERKKASAENIFEATPEQVYQFVDKFIKEGYEFSTSKGDVIKVPAEKVKKTLEDEFEDIEAAKAAFVERLEIIKQEQPPVWATGRDVMPVINPGDEVEAIATALKGGEIDVYEPYYGGEEKEAVITESKNTLSISRKRLQQIIKEELANRKKR